MNTGQYDPILGLSYYQLGLQARANHLCQRIGQLRGLPGEHLSKWVPQDAVLPVVEGETDLFDGVPIGFDRLRLFLNNETSETSIAVREGLNDLQLQIRDSERRLRCEGPLEDS